MPTASLTVADIELSADRFDPARAAAIYREHGCLVVRGLMRPYVASVRADVDAAVEDTLAHLDRAVKIPEGWVTPNGTLMLPAPKNFARDKQIMVLATTYRHSAAFFQSALDPRLLDTAEQILGPNVELFMEGQCLYKEPVGGHPKMLHQDAAYFEHKYQGPMAVLNYLVDCDEQNGCLYVVPGSHKLGKLRHVDTESHLGLSLDEWPWERALPIHGRAGDAIFFHVYTIHGSKPNWSPHPRPVFIHRYRAADDYIVVSATSVDNMAEAEKHKEEARKENQLGLMVRGTRRYEPQRMV